MAKIAIGGPPHSGKSVLVSVLKNCLPQSRYAVVEGAPDGEGITGWSHDGDAELVKAVRRKGKFLPGFVQWVVDSLKNSTAPITLADLGGMLLTEKGEFSPLGKTLTPQNEQIVSECDYLIVIASPKWSAAVPNWIAEGHRLGVKPFAILDSILEGAEDEVFERSVPFKARITKLEREFPPTGSTTARSLARLIDEIAGEGTRTDGSEAADVNFPALAEGLNLPVHNGGVNRDWFPGVAIGLLQLISVRVAGQQEVNLWGNCSAGWPYHMLACSLAQGVRYYDPKVSMGYVPLPEVEPQGQGSQILDWRVEERDEHSFVEFVIPRQIFDVANLPLVLPPAVARGKGVVISGKGPWWLTGTIARAYARSNASWAAVFTPQESSRRDSEGKKWIEKFPGLAPAVVIASRDAAVPVGSVVPFRLPG